MPQDRLGPFILVLDCGGFMKANSWSMLVCLWFASLHPDPPAPCFPSAVFFSFNSANKQLPFFCPTGFWAFKGTLRCPPMRMIQRPSGKLRATWTRSSRHRLRRCPLAKSKIRRPKVDPGERPSSPTVKLLLFGGFPTKSAQPPNEFLAWMCTKTGVWDSIEMAAKRNPPKEFSDFYRTPMS